MALQSPPDPFKKVRYGGWRRADWIDWERLGMIWLMPQSLDALERRVKTFWVSHNENKELAQRHVHTNHLSVIKQKQSRIPQQVPCHRNPEH